MSAPPDNKVKATGRVESTDQNVALFELVHSSMEPERERARKETFGATTNHKSATLGKKHKREDFVTTQGNQEQGVI